LIVRLAKWLTVETVRGSSGFDSPTDR
jgi:hypothetical protein